MAQLDHTHDPSAESWIESANSDTDFPLQNLPFGVFRPKSEARARGGVAIGGQILDLGAAIAAGALSGDAADIARKADAATLNDFFAQGRARLRVLRHELFSLLHKNAEGTEAADAAGVALYPQADCDLLLPMEVSGYTDFYAGINHARNVGSLFRPDNPLMPNYRHIPIGYNGRASSVRASGTDFKWPHGQIKSPDEDMPRFGPSARVDFELEMGIWIAEENALGTPVSIEEAEDRIAGLCLLNDWSARDIQAWEYQPLGPFLSKSFGTLVSPWVVTLDALAPFRAPAMPRGEDAPALQTYLDPGEAASESGFNVDLAVHLTTPAMRKKKAEPALIGQSSMRHLYWSAAQMVAHHTVNGCNLQPGDLLGTGTISGEVRESLGSLLEMTRGGKEPLDLPGGETRTFVEDGDEIALAGRAVADGAKSIGFGPCRGAILR